MFSSLYDSVYYLYRCIEEVIFFTKYTKSGPKVKFFGRGIPVTCELQWIVMIGSYLFCCIEKYIGMHYN